MIKRSIGSENPLVALNVTRKYQLGKVEVTALKGVSLTVGAGEFVALAGTSGSGKSTLLNILGCVDQPSQGQIFVDGYDAGSLEQKALAVLRAKKIGFIFQTFNLLPTLSALENVEYPLLILDMPKANRVQLAAEALARVGLGGFMKHRPSEMSGGQRQRVAIARAMVKRPKIILADEPTANLDRRTSESVLALMQELNREEGMTFLFATHDPYVLRLVKRVINLSDGEVVPDAPLMDAVAVAAEGGA